MRLRKRSATDILHKVTPTTSVARGEMQVSLTAITEALNAVFERYGDKIIFEMEKIICKRYVKYKKLILITYQ